MLLTSEEKASLKAKIEVMQAALDGKPVQSKLKSVLNHPWREILNGSHVWDWMAFDYRVKPTKHIIYIYEHDNGELFSSLVTFLGFKLVKTFEVEI